MAKFTVVRTVHVTSHGISDKMEQVLFSIGHAVNGADAARQAETLRIQLEIDLGWIPAPRERNRNEQTKAPRVYVYRRSLPMNKREIRTHPESVKVGDRILEPLYSTFPQFEDWRK